MFHIKVCGITTPQDAIMAADAGADAIGLNFFDKSPRYVALDVAQAIAVAVKGRVKRVGVFVNAAPGEVREIASAGNLDLVQLHGDEPPELAAELSEYCRVMKAFRIGVKGLGPVLEYLDCFRRYGGHMRQVLFDARQPGQYGGTGMTADWDLLTNYPPDERYPPFVLAGGLTSDNVAEAIRTVRPSGVDTASGVEHSPGRKDPARVARFVSEARRALATLSARGL